MKLALIGVALLLSASCSNAQRASSEPAVVTIAPSSTVTTSISQPAAARAEAAPAPTTASTTSTVPAVFSSRIALIDAAVASRMSSSWRTGCPVPLENLRYLTLTHWGYDGRVHAGELVVNAAHADAVVRAFAALFDAGFPIERMQLVDDYGGDDKASMRANNTSAFNCRDVDGRPGVRSAHSWGTAIDINPLVNPWVRGNVVDPPEGAPYADRTQQIRGGIFAGDAAVRAFHDIGWAWGGEWPTSKDWQHFSADGN